MKNRSCFLTTTNSEDKTPANNSMLNNLVLVWPDTKKTQDLTLDNAGYGNVRWSSDETQIAYIGIQGVDAPYIPTENWYAPYTVYVQNLQTGKRKKLFQESAESSQDYDWVLDINQGLQWLPGHSRLLYVSDLPQGLFLLDAQGGKPVRLTQNVPDGFSLASKRAYWTEIERNTSNTPTSTTLRVAALPSSFLKLIHPGVWLGLKWLGTYVIPGDIIELAFSPDGRRLAFSMAAPNIAYNPPIPLAVLELATGTVHLLGTVSHHLQGYRWSHDGRYLLWLYSPPAPGRPRLVAASVDTVAPQPLAKVDWHTKRSVQAMTLLEFAPDTDNIQWREAR